MTRSLLGGTSWAQRIGRAVTALSVLVGLGCNSMQEQRIALPITLDYKDGLLKMAGALSPVQDQACGQQPGDDAEQGSPVPWLLVDTAVPISVFVPGVRTSSAQFSHGQVLLRSAKPDPAQQPMPLPQQAPNLIPGPGRLLLCDYPVVRVDSEPSSFVLERDGVKSGPLGGIVGGDILGRYAMTLQFGAPGSQNEHWKDRAQLTLTNSDIAPWCQLDDAVLPFKPLGGELAVQLGNGVVTYPATRITLGACVEPLADPLRVSAEQACIDRDKMVAAVEDLKNKQALAMPDSQAAEQLKNERALLAQVTSNTCGDDPDLVMLGDLVDRYQLRQPAYESSGVNMRFLLSTALPDIVLSQTACERLANPERCRCTEPKVSLRLPGLNPSDAEAERGCRIQLGSKERTALALVAHVRALSPCAELARSRRQRYALPLLTRPNSTTGQGDQSTCLRESCLQNLQRDAALLARRCGYTGPDTDLACDDHRSPVASVVELGGPGPDSPPSIDKLDALVVPDSARILQSVNSDLRNVSAQVDGVIGVPVLARLVTTIDYPQNRVAASCRCGDQPGHVCRAYRGISYNTADTCSAANELLIPADNGRTYCR